MAQVIVTHSASGLAKQTGTKIHDTAVAGILSKGLEALASDSDASKFGKSMQDIIQSVDELESAIKRVWNGYMDRICSFQGNTLFDPERSINDVYNRIRFYLSARYPSEKEKLGVLQSQLQDELSKACKPECVAHYLASLHDSINDKSIKSLLGEVAERAFAEHDDFVVYYLTIKTWVSPPNARGRAVADSGAVYKVLDLGS